MSDEESGKPGGTGPREVEGKRNARGPGRSINDADAFALEDTFPELDHLFSASGTPSAASSEVLVVLDTNALLLPYLLGKTDLTALEKIFERLASERRLFLPARVVREFIRLRDRKISEMLTALNDHNSRIQLPEAGLSTLLSDVSGYGALISAADQMKEARKAYSKAHKVLPDQIRAWRGDDPVTKLYRKIFRKECMIEHDGTREDVSTDWSLRASRKVPPGYKDAGKDDTGIGDYLIWKSLLFIAKSGGRDLIFVTGEEKADWFVRGGGNPLYPRPELVDEFRRYTGGRTLRLSTLHELLEEMAAPPSVVTDVRQAEEAANSEIQAITSQYFADINNLFLMAGSESDRSEIIGPALTLSISLSGNASTSDLYGRVLSHLVPHLSQYNVLSASNRSLTIRVPNTREVRNTLQRFQRDVRETGPELDIAAALD